MDPNACLLAIEAALTDGDGHEARRLAQSLIEWVDKGGFEPRRADWRQTVRFAMSPLTSGRVTDKFRRASFVADTIRREWEIEATASEDGRVSVDAEDLLIALGLD